MPAPLLEGGCYCGAVRYQVSGRPQFETNCHCTICRRSSGAPYVAWFTVSLDEFKLLQGAPACFDSSAKGRRGFCGRCGTALTFTHADSPELIDLTTGSLDRPEAAPPRDHTWVSSKLAWVHIGDGLPAFPRSRAESPGGAQTRE